MTLNPFQLFSEWLQDSQKLDYHEPGFMALATATQDGIPSIRIVLLKGYDERGFCFYTNLTSRKGKELINNPKAALCFYWDELDRQIRIEGSVERVSEKEADEYFASRSRGSQIGAWASKQSCALEKQSDLPDRVKQITQEFGGMGTIPRPPFWSGFRLKPTAIEFWEKQDFRLHKRTLFSKSPNGWTHTMLYP